MNDHVSVGANVHGVTKVQIIPLDGGSWILDFGTDSPYPKISFHFKTREEIWGLLKDAIAQSRSEEPTE